MVVDEINANGGLLGRKIELSLNPDEAMVPSAVEFGRRPIVWWACQVGYKR